MGAYSSFPLTPTLSLRERELLKPFSLREKVAEGRMRGGVCLFLRLEWSRLNRPLHRLQPTLYILLRLR